MLDGIVVLVIIFIAIIIILFFSKFSTAIQNLTWIIQQEQTQVATLSEKVSRLDPIVQASNNLQVELRGLAERVMQVEQNQTSTHSSIHNLVTGLSQAEAKSTESIYFMGSNLSNELTKIQQELTSLQATARARQEVEQVTAESVRRLEAVIAGTQSKGSAGENILELLFTQLPVEWQVRDFSVGGKVVEFGLKLPNNLVLPIDSKLVATNLVDRLTTSTNVGERQQLKRDIEKSVMNKAKEIGKYIDPSITTPFGIAVVPDAVYDLSLGIHSEIFKLNTVLVSYSMFLPYLLLVFQTILKSSQHIDLHKLEAYVNVTQSSIDSIQEELDGRFSKAITMLNNSKDNMKVHVGKIGSSMVGLQTVTSNSSQSSPYAIIPP